MPGWRRWRSRTHVRPLLIPSGLVPGEGTGGCKRVIIGFMNLVVEEFRAGHLDAAAEMLARSHRADRAACDLLPERFEEAGPCRAAVESVLNTKGSAGVVAIVDGTFAGFLVGAPLDSPPRLPAMWTERCAHAVDPALERSIYRDMYGAISGAWVEGGRLDHYVVVPASDRDALAAWFSLSFGMEQAYALLSLSERASNDAVPTDVEIRIAGPGDRDLVAALAPLISRHQADPPVFAPRMPEDEYIEGHIEMLEDPAARYWLALRLGRPVGFVLMTTPAPADGGLDVPDGCVELSVAATLPEERGTGVGTALTERALAAAARDGHRCCLTDWRTTNLASARFWPRFGFRPVTYRLHRTIDARIADGGIVASD